MKIAQSSVNLVSSHQYYEENTVTVQSGVMTRSSFLDNLQNQAAKEADGSETRDSELKAGSGVGNCQNLKGDVLETTSDKTEEPMGSISYNFLRPKRASQLTTYEESLTEQIAKIRANLLETLLNFLQMIGGDRSRSGYKEMISETSNMLTSQSFVKVTTIEARHVEEEYTSFNGTGMAMTEDGRTIDFNVSFSMSRRFAEYAGVSLSGAVSMIDPLIINVGSDVTSISDQHFYFDLDSDGKEEKIAGLGSGSGFLTYDRNGDGIVNDGRELFGTKSGNGFADLAEFDSDRNGWIDENDEIYGKLRVWLRGEDGVDTLLSLQEADVGAIYLGSAETEYKYMGAVGGNSVAGNSASDIYSMQDSNGSADAGLGMNAGIAAGIATTAMMRASGLFLRESGGVGTVHQVDLARLQKRNKFWRARLE